MLEVTPEAIDAIENILDQSDVEPDDRLRLTEREQGQLSFEIGRERPNDQIVAKGDRTVLIVDAHVSETLDGTTLDVTTELEGAAGPQFTLARRGE